MYHTHPNPELSWAVTLGTSAAVTSLYITGFLAPPMHAALRITIAATTPLPLRLGSWLDDLADRDLLNRIGGGWLFRHPTFRAWLARATLDPTDRSGRGDAVATEPAVAPAGETTRSGRLVNRSARLVT